MGMWRRAARVRDSQPDADGHARSSAFAISNIRATSKPDGCGYDRSAVPIAILDTRATP